MRYHGGKFRLAPWIIAHFPAHRIYVEPFGGAASVLLQKPRSYAEVYNDMNGEIVNVFRVLRDPEMAAELERVLRLTPFARDEFALTYEPSEDPVEQARRTIARTFMGFGSAAHNSDHATGFRCNSNRSGTTPAHDWAHYPREVATFIERLAGVVIENRPAIDVIRQHDGPRTLIYCDPPYPSEARKPRQARNYGEYELSDEEHRELAAVLHECKGMALVSGYPCPLYETLYDDWQMVTRTAYADGAQKRTEALWLSPACAERVGRTLWESAS
jgi:DNA adenine methylase